jgi:hypothetical protein
MISSGSHVEFQISTKNSNIVRYHQMNIPAKFGSDGLGGSIKEDCKAKSDRL